MGQKFYDTGTVALAAGNYPEIARLGNEPTVETNPQPQIVGNTLHGYFSTYSGNVLSEFSCVAA